MQNSTKKVVNGKCVTCNKNVDSSDDGSLHSQNNSFKKGGSEKKGVSDKKAKYEAPELQADPYPEINIPMEYVSQFEMKKDFSPG